MFLTRFPIPSVPLYYGIAEAVILAIFCLGCWKIGWTKAPANENICIVIATSYEVEKARLENPNAIEVVHNPKQDDGNNNIEDLVFTQTTEGYKVDEEALNEPTNAALGSGMAGNISNNITSPSSSEGNIPAEGKEIT